MGVRGVHKLYPRLDEDSDLFGANSRQRPSAPLHVMNAGVTHIHPPTPPPEGSDDTDVGAAGGNQGIYQWWWCSGMNNDN